MLIDNNRLLTGLPMQPQQRIKVAICSPSMDREHADFATALTGMMATSVTNVPVDCYYINHQNSVITDARNRLVQIALEWGAEWLLWLDSDLSFPNDTLIRLLRHNLDIVGATYCQRAHPYSVMGHFKDGEKEDFSDVSLAETHYLPGGLVLVRAEVYKKIPGPWYEDYYNHETPRLIEAVKTWRDKRADDDLLGALDKYEASNPMDRMGEDVDFCHKAALAGYEVWCDLDLTDHVTHIGQVHVRAKLPGREAPEGANIFVPTQEAAQ
jgi:hypothetical protein